MKIKLLYPPRNWDSNFDETCIVSNKEHDLIPPIGLARLTSHLKEKGYTVKQDDLDIKIYRINRNEINGENINLNIFEDEQRVKKYLNGSNDYELIHESEKILNLTDYKGFDLVGFSLISSRLSSISASLVLSKILKEKLDIKIVWGGLPHIQNYFLTFGNVDYIISGRGEKSLELLSNYLDGENVKLYEIPGLSYLKEKKIITNPIKNNPEKFFPNPDFTDLPLELYKYEINGEGILVLPYMFVDGCCFKCAFCPRSELPYLMMNKVNIIVEELKTIKKKYDTRNFFFLNSGINPNYDFTLQLAEEMVKSDLNILWSDCANFKFIDKNLLTKLRDAGAVRLVYGLESASPKMLKYVEKPIKISYSEKILKISNELGIWNEIELITGMPHETEEDIQQTINFINRNKKNINFFYLNSFILKGSSMIKYPKKFGIENIKFDSEGTFDLRMVGRRFDEKNGLKWEEKKEQQLRSFKKILKTIQPTNEIGSDIHSIFYSYSQLI